MSKKRPYYIPADQWIENLNEYILEVASQYLPLQDFGFHETYRDEYHTVILDSEWCRVRFFANWESDYSGQPIRYYLMVFYGRLHAQNESFTMSWQGETCKCWLYPSFDHILEFLNGTFFQSQKPSYAELRKEGSSVRLEDSIHQSLYFESKIWKHYAPELFYLFDLRRPELWEQYRAWLKEKYIAEGRNEKEDERQGLIPYYRVC